MGKKSSYKEEISKLRKEGKKYKEIREILGCSYSSIAYHTIPSEKVRESIRNKKSRKEGIRYKNIKDLQSRNRQIVDSYLLSHPCVDCGNSDIRVLEFDHVRGVKAGNICHAVRRCWSIDKLTTEISKCEVRCCNCHRIVTRERSKSLIKNQTLIN